MDDLIMGRFNKLYWLKKEQSQIESQIKELTVLSAVNMNGLPSGSKVSSPVESYNEKLENLRERLQRKCDEIVTEIKRIEDDIERIEDDETRLIARKRCIGCKTYEAIGNELFLDKSTICKKLKGYFERTK